MTLKTCPCCKIVVTSKTAEKKGRDEFAIYFNCRACESTFIFISKNWQSVLKAQNKQLSLKAVRSS